MITITQNPASTRHLHAGTADAPGFSVSWISHAASSTSEVGPAVADATSITHTTTGGWNDAVVVPLTLNQALTVESLTPGTATVTGHTVTQNGTGGSVMVKVSRGVVGKILSYDNSAVPRSWTAFDSYTSGSLSRLLADNVLDKLTTGKQANQFTAFDFHTGSFTRNPDFVLAGVNLSGLAVRTDIFIAWSAANRGALITPQHMLAARHWQFSNPHVATSGGLEAGQKVSWLGTDDVLYTRTIAAVIREYGDIVLATLDSPLPSAVMPLQIAGDWYSREKSLDAHGILSSYQGGAAFWIGQDLKANYLLCGAGAVIKNTGSSGSVTLNGHTYTHVDSLAYFQSPVDPGGYIPSLVAGKTAFRHSGIIGDSGSAVFLLIDNAPVLLCTWTGPTAGIAVWESNGAVLNDLIYLSDAAAGTQTGYTVTVAANPLP